VPVPTTATPGTTFARFRFSSTGGLSYDGLASDGEVEDYQIEISNYNPNISITKTVLNNTGWSDSTRANINDTIRFNISVHNTGDENLTGINVTDYLPDCLQYAGNSTINSVSQEPNSTWGNNITWLFNGPLSPDSWIYIEFNRYESFYQ